MDFLTVPKAAKVLGRHKQTLYRWIAKGELITINIGGILFVPRSEIERLKNGLCRESETGKGWKYLGLEAVGLIMRSVWEKPDGSIVTFEVEGNDGLE
jgi:excisionase family DNA binding protein